MGNLEATENAYFGRENPKEETVIPEKDKMGLVQALMILHSLRDGLSSCEEVREAFNTIFEWIDNAVLIFKKMGDH